MDGYRGPGRSRILLGEKMIEHFEFGFFFGAGFVVVQWLLGKVLK
jgi:hypothetical protein